MKSTENRVVALSPAPFTEMTNYAFNYAKVRKMEPILHFTCTAKIFNNGKKRIDI